MKYILILLLTTCSLQAMEMITHRTTIHKKAHRRNKSDNATNTFDQEKKIVKKIYNNRECTICLDTLKHYKGPLNIFRCGHAYHGECAKNLIEVRDYRCPECRIPFMKNPEVIIPIANPVNNPIGHNARSTCDKEMLRCCCKNLGLITASCATAGILTTIGIVALQLNGIISLP